MGDHGTVLSQRVASGQVDLSRLSERWQLLEALYDAARAVIDNRSPDGLCARMIDERQVAGHRVYMTAERYLGVAWDNHAALVALIQSPHGLTPSAPWNLLRPTFEAAFHAVWVLDPEESLERRAVPCGSSGSTSSITAATTTKSCKCGRLPETQTGRRRDGTWRKGRTPTRPATGPMPRHSTCPGRQPTSTSATNSAG